MTTTADLAERYVDVLTSAVVKDILAHPDDDHRILTRRIHARLPGLNDEPHSVTLETAVEVAALASRIATDLTEDLARSSRPPDEDWIPTAHDILDTLAEVFAP